VQYLSGQQEAAEGADFPKFGADPVGVARYGHVASQTL